MHNNRYIITRKQNQKKMAEKRKKTKRLNTRPIFIASFSIPLIGYLLSLDNVRYYIQDFIGKKELSGITELWFTSKTYDMLPGLFFGLLFALFGVLSGFLFRKNSNKYFNIMSITIMLIFLGGIVFGVVASFYNQPESVVFGFIQGGYMSLIIVGIFWYIFNRI